ncbi:hypothetical protein VTL71DRAFT_7589 [Oculimacula yallundae]|uniref:Uncharacterized protein n=1 Tax=Oculimacula yallundae TaxID=86028 RepID=A0ABR4BUM6_9HELO
MLGPHMTGSEIWSTTIITLSFTQTYLLHALFSISALHLAHLHFTNTSEEQQDLAEKYYHIATIYHTKCITSYRREIERLAANNSAACVACAALLGLFAWATPGARGADLFFPAEPLTSAPFDEHKMSPTIKSSPSRSTASQPSSKAVPWYKIHRGGHHIISNSHNWISESIYHEIIDPWQEISYFHTDRTSSCSNASSLSPNDAVQLSALSACWTDISHTTGSDIHLSDEDIQALDETLQTLHYIFRLPSISEPRNTETLFPSPSTSASNIPLPQPEFKISAGIATLSWTIFIPSHFCDMVEDRVPQALILVAVYCVVLKRAEDLWYIKGKAESLLHAVERELRLKGGGEWERWLEWPKLEVRVS